MRHDDTPPFKRIISPNHPSVRGAQARMIAEIDQWLQEDEQALRTQRFYRRFEAWFTGTMLALILILGIILITYNTWRFLCH